MPDPIPPRTSIVLLHWGRTGAGPRFTHELTKALRARTDVTVAVSYVADTERSAEFASLDVAQLPLKTYRSAWGLVLGLPRLLANVVRFRRFLRDVDAEVVITPMFSLWQSFAIRLLVPKGTCHLATVHDAAPHPGDDHVLKRWAQAAEVRRADGVIVLSASVAAELEARRTTAAPVFVSVHGAFGSPEAKTVRTRAVNDPPVLGFFGRILPYKGVDLLVDATAILAAEGTPVVARIHGEGSPDGLAPGSHDHVEWHLGWVPETATNAVVSTFDILALPYREASQSGVLAIALAEGVPVVATPVGGLREQVEEAGCGIVASAPTASALAAAVSQLLTSNELYEACSRNGLEAAASEFGWTRVGTDYVHAVEQVLRR